MRGFGKNRASSVSPFHLKPVIVNLADLEKYFKDGDKIIPKSLLASGLVKAVGSKMPEIKILGGGKDTSKKRFSFDKSILMSASVRAKLEK